MRLTQEERAWLIEATANALMPKHVKQVLKAEKAIARSKGIKSMKTITHNVKWKYGKGYGAANPWDHRP